MDQLNIKFLRIYNFGCSYGVLDLSGPLKVVYNNRVRHEWIFHFGYRYMKQTGQTTMLSARYPNEVATAIRQQADRLGVSVSELLIEGARKAVELRKEAGA